MPKKIILYRHGKSDWDADYSNDHERPLAERGIKSAKTMGQLLACSEQFPELVITSSAIRAKQTLELSIKAGNWTCEVIENDSLYYGGIEAIHEIIKNLPKNYSRVMLVGHEPKWSSLCSKFIGGGDITFPTAAMARIDFECSKWQDLKFGMGTLRWMLQPSFFTKGQFTQFE